MRVLHVITGLNAGGAEQQLLLLLRYLNADCEVATLTNPGSVAAALRADGVPVHDLRMRGNRDLAVLPRLARLIRSGRYDVVHTHLFRAGLYGRIVARLARVPAIVATEHSIGETQIEQRRMSGSVRVLYRMAERFGDMTVAVSPTVADRLTAWGVPPARVTVIPNGIDAHAFRRDPATRQRLRERLGIAPDAFVVGGVGRLEPGKRFDVLIEAVAGIDDAVLLLVGTGSAQDALLRLVERHGLTDRTVFTGESTRVAAHMSVMDVLAAPSPEETFGLAVLEALAAGLPVRYVTCPALDDLDNPNNQPALADVNGVEVAAARRIPLDVGAFRSELAELAGRAEPVGPVGPAAPAGPAVPLVPPEPASVSAAEGADGAAPAAVLHYDIVRVAAEITGLYEQLLGTGTGDTRACAPSWGGTR